MHRCEKHNIDTRRRRVRSRTTATWTSSHSETSPSGAESSNQAGRWSNDVKPIAGTDSCQTRHTGICLSKSMTVQLDDGYEATVGPGDFLVIEPGHDAWTVVDEPCVLLDPGIAAYAKPA